MHSRSATEVQVLEDAERLIAAWNERQAQRMSMLFSPTIGAAVSPHGVRVTAMERVAIAVVVGLVIGITLAGVRVHFLP